MGAPFLVQQHQTAAASPCCRYFYAQLLLGTPPKAYATIIDTGSSITYIPCSKCQHCGTHMVSLQLCVPDAANSTCSSRSSPPSLSQLKACWHPSLYCV